MNWMLMRLLRLLTCIDRICQGGLFLIGRFGGYLKDDDQLAILLITSLLWR